MRSARTTPATPLRTAHRPSAMVSQRVAQPVGAPAAGNSIQRCACGGQCPSCQNNGGRSQRLPVNQPGDSTEHEANHIADRITSEGHTTAKAPPSLTPTGNHRVQRQFAQGSNRDLEVPAPIDSSAPPSVHEVLRSPGQPLDAGTRTMMEPCFGYDFSKVRVHKDDRAAESAQEVHANAYTVGQDIVFGAGRLSPGTQEGRRLLAHELTHVVQQSGPAASGSARSLESEAHTVGERASAGREVSVSGAAPKGALQRDEDGTEAGAIMTIAKGNGRIAVVFVRNGKIVKGYAEIVPPPGVSAANAIENGMVVAKAAKGTERSAVPDVDVIIPPEWSRRQPVNPNAKVQIKDTKEAEREDELELRAAARKEKADKLRNIYRQYLADQAYQYEKFGTIIHHTNDLYGNPADTKSDDEILAMPGDNLFFEWMQRRQTKRDWQRFQAEAREMGYDDPKGIKEMWKTYEQPKIEEKLESEKELHDLKYDTAHALQQTYATPLLLGWMKSKPKPVEVSVGDAAKKVYVLPLPDGNIVTLDEAQFAKMQQLAKDRIETELNRIQTQKDLYQFHKNDRSLAGEITDAAAFAKLEGKTWEEIDKSIQAGRAALAEGDLETCLSHMQDAEKNGKIANREWNRYLHKRDVAGEVWIAGWETIEVGSEIILAIGTAPLGGEGLLIVTGKGVGQSVVLAAAQEIGGQHVDKGDLAFDISTQVVTGLALHGFGKLQALGPDNMIMKAIRESYAGQLGTDVVQSILVDSATYAAKREYEQARGRGEKFTEQDFMNHFKDYLSDPGKLPLEVLKAQALRHAAGPVGEFAESRGIPLKAQAAKGATPEHPASTDPLPGKEQQVQSPLPVDAPQSEITTQPAAQPEVGGKAPPAQELKKKASVTVEIADPIRQEKPTASEAKPGKESGPIETRPAAPGKTTASPETSKPPVPASSVKQNPQGLTTNEPVQAGAGPDRTTAGITPPQLITELPESSVVSNLTHEDATKVYDTSIREDPHREVGIWEDIQTGERVVVQGNSGTVDTTTVLYSEPEFSDRQWKMVEHYHPGDDAMARIPSDQDFKVITHWQREGVEPRGPVKSEVRYIDPLTGETRTTEFGYDPDAGKQYYVDYTDMAGQRQHKEFVEPPWAEGSDYKRFTEGFIGESGEPAHPSSSGIEAEPPTLRRPTVEEGNEQGGQQESGAKEQAQNSDIVASEDAEPPTLRQPNASGSKPPHPASPKETTRPPVRRIVRPGWESKPLPEAASTVAAHPSSPEDVAAAMTRRPNESEGNFIDRVATAMERADQQSRGGPPGRGKENPSRWTRAQSTFGRLVGAMRNMQSRLLREGNGVRLPQVDDSVLATPLDEFVRRNPALSNTLDQLVGKLTEQARATSQPLTDSPEFKDLQDFLGGKRREGAREISGLKPDIAEFILDDGRIHISDVTTQSLAPLSVHSFKTRVYVEIMKAIVGPNGPQVSGQDIEMHTDTSGQHIDPAQTRFGDMIE